MNALYLILLVLSLVCFALDAFDANRLRFRNRPVALLALGLAFWVAVPVIQYARVVF